MGGWFGNSTRGLMIGGGVTGAVEGAVDEFLNGGGPLDILSSALENGVLGSLLMGGLSKIFKCFSKDTIVWTSEGPKPIGEVRPGEKVRAFHFEYGEWVHAAVLERSDNLYEGPVVTVEVGGSKIETTVYHPFWVVEGQNLDERAVPKELLPEEDEGKSLKGRWVNSHDLRAGDKIYSLSGKLETIKAVSQRFEENFAVCNLEIDGLHNYAVGLCGVLVHNSAGCGSLTRLGVSRDSAGWRTLRDLWDNIGFGDILSTLNRRRIARGYVPRVDDHWLQWFPGDAKYLGKKINLHHVGGTPLTVPLPNPRHLDAHMPGGYRYNPGGPGTSG